MENAPSLNAHFTFSIFSFTFETTFVTSSDRENKGVVNTLRGYCERRRRRARDTYARPIEIGNADVRIERTGTKRHGTEN